MSYTVSIKEVTEVPHYPGNARSTLPLLGRDLLVHSDFPNQKLLVFKENKVTAVQLKFSGEMRGFLKTDVAWFEITACGDFESITHDVKAIPDVLECGADSHVFSLINAHLEAALVCGLRKIDPFRRFPMTAPLIES